MGQTCAGEPAGPVRGCKVPSVVCLCLCVCVTRQQAGREAGGRWQRDLALGFTVLGTVQHGWLVGWL